MSEAKEVKKVEYAIKLAEQQLLGFAHASRGYDIISLAEAMGLSGREWIDIRDESDLKESDKEILNNYYQTSHER